MENLFRIPENRKVTWGDLFRIQADHALLKKHAQRIFGINVAKWAQFVNTPEIEVKDHAVAMLARMYADHPADLVKPMIIWTRQDPDGDSESSMRFFIEKHLAGFADDAIKKRHVGPLFGRDASTGYYWIDQSKGANRAVRVLAHAVTQSPPFTRGALEPLVYYSGIEAALSDGRPFESGRWREKK